MSNAVDGGQLMSSGEFARAAACSTDTVRHWDKVGLLRPTQRTSFGDRLYKAEQLERARELLARRNGGPRGRRLVDAE
jgi:MerR family transcriptional regulator, thiopeptide resistance regulator